ncbi:uncharacterized protein GIQ15_00494 [Arthroderma uncinatum]|uniref:uncharacterized protein n=1 Tax=Arthroderma uncinatum TaxID=74035 RepID=UPI00144AD280|nr:uncharacterized protein GIQ15_00494 [Arthroderma uncinatum]KAF3490977.1 hypothetical protein GIQ15_00494 [Arthroderma uncinatum]
MFSGSRYCLSRKASTPVAENISAVLKNEPLLFLYPPAFASAVESSIQLTTVRSPPYNKRQSKARISREAEDTPPSRPQWTISPQQSSEQPRNESIQPQQSSPEHAVPHDTVKHQPVLEHTPHDNIQPPPVVEHVQDDSKLQSNRKQSASSIPHRTPYPPPPRLQTPGLHSEVNDIVAQENVQSTSGNYKTEGRPIDRIVPAKRGNPTGWIKKSAKGTPLRYTKRMAELDRQPGTANPYSAPTYPPLRYIRHGYNDPISHRLHPPKTPEAHRWNVQSRIGICQILIESIQDIFATKQELPTDEYQKTIFLNEQEVVGLLGDERENMWVIPLLSGCRAHVLPQKSNSFEPRSLVLSGTQPAVEAAEKHIRELIQKLPKSNLPPFAPPLENPRQKPVIRSVWVSLPPEPLQPQKNEISTPETWTVKSFADYIEDLVNTPVSRLVHGRLKHALDMSHRDVIGDMIRRLLLDPENRNFFSSRSISLSVSYFARSHGRASLQSLLPAFEGLMTSRTANSLVRAAVLRRDFVVLNWCISAMKRQRIHPRNWIWVSILSAITPHTLRFDVLVRAKESGVLDDQHVFQVAVSTAIQPVFGQWLKGGGSVPGFIEAMDQKLGNGWLSVRAIDRLLLEGSLSSKPEAITDILLFCKQNSFKLGTMSLNNALFYFLHQSDTADTSFIELYLKFTETFQSKGDDRTMDILWHLAWRARSYNICRVLWRYGCLDGWVTQKMQASIYSSLRRETNSSVPERELWLQNIGKVVAGVIPFNRLKKGIREDFTKLVHGEHIPISDDDMPDPSTQRSELAKRLVHSDITALENAYAHKEPLDKALARAYALDKEWGPCHDKPVKWLRENSVQVNSARCIKPAPPKSNSTKPTKPEPISLDG